MGWYSVYSNLKYDMLIRRRHITTIIYNVFHKTIFKMKQDFLNFETPQIIQVASASFCLRLATGLILTDNFKFLNDKRSDFYQHNFKLHNIVLI